MKQQIQISNLAAQNGVEKKARKINIKKFIKKAEPPACGTRKEEEDPLSRNEEEDPLDNNTQSTTQTTPAFEIPQLKLPIESLENKKARLAQYI